MRRLSLDCLAFASLALAPVLLGFTQVGCTNATHDENVFRAAEAIQGGTVDQGDTAVVAILINTSQGMSLCTGSLIGPNLVLSAHHCVADNASTSCGSNSFGALYPAADFRVTTSYNAAAQIFNSSTAQLPSPDGVTWFGVSSVAVPGGNICGQDMSALRLSSAISGVCPLIPSVDTDVTDNEAYTAVGFGITTPNGNAAGTRYHVTGMTVSCAEDCNDPTQSATQEWLGVNPANKGTCEGDSGGPALDSTGRVIGSVSRGPANACNQTVYESVFGEATWIKQMAAQAATAGGYTAAGWVTGAATNNPANGYCGGSSTSSSSSSTSSTSSSSSSSSGGACSHDVCTAGAKLVSGCDACVTQVCGTDTYCCNNKWDAQCVGEVASVCGQSCSGSSSVASSSSSTASSSSSGGTTCGFTTNATCDACLTSSCCAQETACANDQSCVTCVTSNTPPASCNTQQDVVAFANCINNTCGQACGASSTSSSSSSSSGTSTSGTSTSGGNTSSSSSGSNTGTGGSSSSGSNTGTSSSGTFAGSGGATGSGNGSGGSSGSGRGAVTVTSGGNDGTGGSGGGTTTPSGCSVSGAGSEPASPASLAGLLLGAAMVVSRRRPRTGR